MEEVTLRKKVILELYKTERDYINDLGLTTKPLIEKGILTDEQTKILFGNIEELPDLNRECFLKSMESQFDIAEAEGRDTGTIAVGDIFISFATRLATYTEYCVNQPQALDMLSQLEKGDPEFAQYIKGVMDNEPAVKGLSLNSYLIKPVQRLCKYPLLIRELMAKTDEEEEEYKRLEQAMSTLGEAVQSVNEVQREAEAKSAQRQAAIERLAGSIEGADDIMKPDANRFIIRIGEVKRLGKKSGKLKQRTLLLFNNLIVLVGPKSEKQVFKKGAKLFMLDWSVKMGDASMTDIADSSVLSSSIEVTNAFELQSKSRGKGVIVCCADLQDKRAWVKDVREHLKEFQRQEAKRRKFNPVPENPPVKSTKSQRATLQSRATLQPRGKATSGGLSSGTSTPDRRQSENESHEGAPPVGPVASPPPAAGGSRIHTFLGGFLGSRSKKDKDPKDKDKDKKKKKDEKSMMLDDDDLELSQSSGNSPSTTPRTDENVSFMDTSTSTFSTTYSNTFQTDTSTTYTASLPPESPEATLSSSPTATLQVLPPTDEPPPLELPPAVSDPKPISAESATAEAPSPTNPPSSPKSVASDDGNTTPLPSTSPPSTPPPSTSPLGSASDNPAPSTPPVAQNRTGRPTPPAAAARAPLSNSSPTNPVRSRPPLVKTQTKDGFGRPALVAAEVPPSLPAKQPEVVVAPPKPIRDEVATDALLRCAFNGNLGGVRYYVENMTIAVDSANIDSRTPLHIACAEGHLDVVKYLVSKGARLGPVDRFGRKPFDEATASNRTTILEFWSNIESSRRDPDNVPQTMADVPRPTERPPVADRSRPLPAPGPIGRFPPRPRAADLPLPPSPSGESRTRKKSRSFSGMSSLPPAQRANILRIRQGTVAEEASEGESTWNNAATPSRSRPLPLPARSRQLPVPPSPSSQTPPS